MREAQNGQTKKDEVARACERLQWSLQAFLEKKPEEPGTQWGKQWKAFQKDMRKDGWIEQLEGITKSLDN